MTRLLPILIILITLLAACGGAPAAVEPATAPAPTAEAADPVVEPTSASAAATTRTVTHAFGSAEVPLRPQRVVALDAFFTLTPLIELGVPVVGSVSLGEPVAYPGLTEAESAGITSVGSGRLASLEAVAALKPDLIIGVDFVEPPYDQLSQIAPTVIIPTALDWKAQHRALGEATGRLEQAEQGIAAYQARVADLKARMPRVTVSYLTLTGETPGLYTMGPQAWAPARVLDDAGVQRPADEITSEGSFFKSLSLEVLPELKGDVLLYATGYPGIDTTSAGYAPAVTTSPIWQQIPAVKAGRAYQVTGACWETFGGLRSANCVLDDIERLLSISPQASRYDPAW
ncbi:MAG TPA: iron-siderophore ABC transporter substrate-binding protein [Roseiflexaceae bacterium]|nr:iron-siderophore ABC transporter substrate-binding protein [Roseiflexaceae bacterium]